MSDYVPASRKSATTNIFKFNGDDVALEFSEMDSEDWEQIPPEEQEARMNSVTEFPLPFGLTSFASGSVVLADVGEVQQFLFFFFLQTISSLRHGREHRNL